MRPFLSFLADGVSSDWREIQIFIPYDNIIDIFKLNTSLFIFLLKYLLIKHYLMKIKIYLQKISIDFIKGIVRFLK